MKRGLAGIALTAALSAGVGARGAQAPSAAVHALAPLPQLDAAQARGRAFAMRRCGGCHNTGPDDGPPDEGPAFREVAIRYDSEALERRFAEVSAHGVDRMPPVSFTREEADDLIAYFKYLQGFK